MQENIVQFVEDRKPLFWDIPQKSLSKLSLNAVVERILSYGNMADCEEMFSIIGIKEVAKIFKEISTKKRVNLRPATINFFNLVFQKHAS